MPDLVDAVDIGQGVLASDAVLGQLSGTWTLGGSGCAGGCIPPNNAAGRALATGAENSNQSTQA